MSTSILPSLAGLGFDVTRTPVWDTTVQTAISGKESRIALQTYPRWKWELVYNILRSASAYAEFQQLAGFFNSLKGQFDSFLYTDPDDNTAVDQELGIGDGATTAFQLVRAFGGFIEPVLAPNNSGPPFLVYVNGVSQYPVGVSVWGTTTPGVITLPSAPASGATVTATFSYYWPCRMSDDSLPFNMFLNQMYGVKKFAFISCKN